MTRNEDDSASPQAWLQHAKSNLILAERGRRIKGFLLEDLCFNAQQAAEKALKAVCIQHNLDFPKTHSLVRLMDILEAGSISMPDEVKQADVLTQYAVQARYPEWEEEITEEEYKDVLALAARVVFWTEKTLAE
jgi:HEPN domain-containing protein